MAGNLSPKLDSLLANPIVNGQLLGPITVAAGANTINHGLGRDLVGYFVTRNSAAVTFYDSQTTNQRPEFFLILNATGAATIYLYVF